MPQARPRPIPTQEHKIFARQLTRYLRHMRQSKVLKPLPQPDLQPLAVETGFTPRPGTRAETVIWELSKPKCNRWKKTGKGNKTNYFCEAWSLTSKFWSNLIVPICTPQFDYFRLMNHNNKLIQSEMRYDFSLKTFLEIKLNYQNRLYFIFGD